MKAVFVVLGMVVSLSCFSQALSREEQNKVDNTIKVIKSEHQFDTVKTTKVSGLRIQQNDTTKIVRIGPCTSKRWNANNHPLIVVDGVVQEFSSLERLNPNDIQSIEILKDQKALEKFGEKGKMGVILVTMKCKEQNTPSL